MSGGLDRRAPRWIVLSDVRRVRSAHRPQAASRFGWRLMAANNRPLGRATTLALTLEACVLHARDVHLAARALSLRPAIGLAPAGDGWVWQALVGDLPAAVATHPFVRRGECSRAFRQFAAAAAVAEPTADRVRHYGPSALRGYHDLVDGLIADRVRIPDGNDAAGRVQ